MSLVVLEVDNLKISRLVSGDFTSQFVSWILPSFDDKLKACNPTWTTVEIPGSTGLSQAEQARPQPRGRRGQLLADGTPPSAMVAELPGQRQ